MRAVLMLESSRRHLNLRALTGCAAVALALTGCGTEAETPEDLPTQESPTATAPAVDATTEDGPTSTASPSATPTPSATTTDEPTAGTAASAEVITGAVEATLAEGSAAFTTEVTLDSPELSDSAQSSGAIDFEGDRRQVDLATRSGELQTVLRPDGVLASLGEGMGWVRADPADLRGTPLEAFGLATVPLQDPAVNLSLLRGATEDVEELGTEDIDGEPTTHYRLTADVQRAAELADADTRQAIDTLGAGSGATVEMEVWVDGEERIRRVLQRTALDQSEVLDTQAEGTVQVTADLTRFGQPVDIPEPDEAEILDLDEALLQRLVDELTSGV